MLATDPNQDPEDETAHDVDGDSSPRMGADVHDPGEAVAGQGAERAPDSNQMTVDMAV